MKRTILKIGDIFCIPLQTGQYAYGQLVFRDSTSEYPYQFMVRIFDFFSKEIIDISELDTTRLLFPPVFTGLLGAIRDDAWYIIGRKPVEDFTFPLFRVCKFYDAPGKYDRWYLWDGQKETFLGELPENYRLLENLCLWGYELLRERIEERQQTGTDSMDLWY